MPLPDHFSFNQNNLQDYVDCPRRFYLRHIQKLEWPAIESQPVLEQEHLMELGRQFHLMVQQKFSGIPVQMITQSTQDLQLLAWWSQFLSLAIDELPGQKLCEVLFSIPMANYRLVAKYDLLVIQPDGLINIFDWKTTHKAPKRTTLLNRLQTKVYPYLLTKLPSQKNQFSGIAPDLMKMIYWYPDPTLPQIEFVYSTDQFQKDEIFITDLIEEIGSLPEEKFEKTNEIRKCNFCRYRTLCDRGFLAGTVSKDEPEYSENIFDLDLDDLSTGDE